MRTVLSVFSRRDAALAAAGQLLERGFDQPDVAVHVRSINPGGLDGHLTDELVTGGLVHDFMGLLENLFGTGRANSLGGEYAQAVKGSGAVVVVGAASDADAKRALDILLAAGATSQSIVPREGDLD